MYCLTDIWRQPGNFLTTDKTKITGLRGCWNQKSINTYFIGTFFFLHGQNRLVVGPKRLHHQPTEEDRGCQAQPGGAAASRSFLFHPDFWFVRALNELNLKWNISSKIDAQTRVLRTAASKTERRTRRQTRATPLLLTVIRMSKFCPKIVRVFLIHFGVQSSRFVLSFLRKIIFSWFYLTWFNTSGRQVMQLLGH